MHQETKENDRQRVRSLFLFIRRCLEVKARGCRGKDSACPFPVSAPPCGAFSNAPAVNRACSTKRQVYHLCGVKQSKASVAVGCSAGNLLARMRHTMQGEACRSSDCMRRHAIAVAAHTARLGPAEAVTACGTQARCRRHRHVLASGAPWRIYLSCDRWVGGRKKEGYTLKHDP